MIRQRLHSPELRTICYDTETRTMVVELPDGTKKTYFPVSLEAYSSIAGSRFPEKTYHRFLRTFAPVEKNPKT